MSLSRPVNFIVVLWHLPLLWRHFNGEKRNFTNNIINATQMQMPGPFLTPVHNAAKLEYFKGVLKITTFATTAGMLPIDDTWQQSFKQKISQNKETIAYLQFFACFHRIYTQPLFPFQAYLQSDFRRKGSTGNGFVLCCRRWLDRSMESVQSNTIVRIQQKM